MAKAKRSGKKAAGSSASRKRASAGSKRKKRASKIKAADQEPAEASKSGHGPGKKSSRKPTRKKTVARKRTAKDADSAASTASAKQDKANAERPKRKPVPHCNELDGKRWIQNSISVWSDIRKTAEEQRLKHPAMFPGMLVERLVETFLRPEGERILDPFSGSGSTVVEVERLGKTGIGIELSPEYVAMSSSRLVDVTSSLFSKNKKPRSVIHEASVSDLTTLVDPDSIDLCITSPPYWDILNQRRSADYKKTRHYGNLSGDLGTIADYDEFLESLKTVFADVFTVLKPGAYCCVVLMDLRKKNRFFPFHSDFAARMTDVGFIFDDLIIWNRQSEYNNLRPLGYPAVFRVNKVHEFIVLLQKPREK